MPAADWFAHHGTGLRQGDRLHETALGNARGRLLRLAAGLFAAAALVYTAKNFTRASHQMGPKNGTGTFWQRPAGRSHAAAAIVW